MGAAKITYDLSVDGIRTRITEAGTGTPLLLVHGLGGPLMWQRVIEPLARRFHVFVIDLPGCGDSGSPPRPFTASDHGRFIRTFLEQQQIANATLAGISYGGQVVVHAAAESGAGARIARLVLICSTGLIRESPLARNPLSWPAIRFVVKHTVMRSRRLLCLFGRVSFFDARSRPAGLCAEFYRQLALPGHRDAWLDGLRETLAGGKEFLSLLSALSIPTLVLWGECDRTVSLSYAEKFCTAIPHSRLVTFPQCAHSVPLEKPEEFSQAVRAFVEEAG